MHVYNSNTHLMSRKLNHISNNTDIVNQAIFSLVNAVCFCQAQPQPQLQLSWAEIALFSTNRATHPPTRIVERWTNAHNTWAIYQSIYISSLKLLHLDYFTNCSRLVQILFITCSRNLFRTCSQLFNIFPLFIYELLLVYTSQKLLH